MIHLSVAHEIAPNAQGLFWVGNFAPGYTNDRDFKSRIHLRSEPDRWAALKDLYATINQECPFEQGWFLHLFVDACWDNTYITAYNTNLK